MSVNLKYMLLETTMFSYLNNNHAIEFSIILNWPTGQISISNFIQINCKICEKMSTEVLAPSYIGDLEISSRLFNRYTSILFSSGYNNIKFERNRSVNVRM